MEAILNQLNLEAFGVYAVTVGILLFWVQCLRVDLKDERAYSRKRDEKHHEMGQKFIEMMVRVEAFLFARGGPE